MARVTVEDCLDNVDNRFELVLAASNGREPMVDWENDKPTVVALREISAGLVDRSILYTHANSEAELLGADADAGQEEA